MTDEIIKIYYEELPKRENGRIDWFKSLNCYVRFQCIDIIGKFKIIKIDREGNNITYIHLQYNDSIFTLRYGSFLKSKIKTIIYPNKFNYKIGERIVDNKKDFTITELKTKYDKKYNRYIKVCSYHCNKCSYDGESDESRIRSMGCPCCGTNSYVVVQGINDIPTTAPWMIPYFQGGYDEAKMYSYGSDHKIYPRCPDCGRIKDHKMSISVIHRQHGIGCKCSDGISYPEKFFISLLEQLNIKYIYQLSKKDFDWCKNFRYDFYLIDYKYIIELHGSQHYNEVKFLTKKGKPKQIIIDKTKKENAIKNVNKYIEINCSKSEMNWMIKNIEESFLSKIFNLSIVDYKKCEEFTCKNIVKEICAYYNKNDEIQTKDISEKYNLSCSTIIRYLHKGNDIGWCAYDARKNRKKQCENLKKINSMNVEIYKNDILVKSYSSLQEAELNTLNDLGIKLYSSSISQHYKNNKSYHGYTFKIYKNGILL